MSPQGPSDQFPFDLPAGDTITIHISNTGDPIDFFIGNATDTLYSEYAISTILDDVWNVPREGSYTFQVSLSDAVGNTNYHIVLGSEIIPEFPTWTSMLLILFALTVAIIIYKRRLLKTPTH